MNRSLKFLYFSAEARGLSEGFIQAGFEPAAHIESNKAACLTLRTRMAYHWLKGRNQIELYADYLNGKLRHPDFYEAEVSRNMLSYFRRNKSSKSQG